VELGAVLVPLVLQNPAIKDVASIDFSIICFDLICGNIWYMVNLVYYKKYGGEVWLAA
jgi:hypothetical protein